MITRRDLFVAFAAVAATAGVFALAEQRPAMDSAVFDWNAMTAKPTAVGSTRSVFSERTATLERSIQGSRRTRLTGIQTRNWSSSAREPSRCFRRASGSVSAPAR
jgi:hypothetical protein